jgi:competence protein ComEC
MLGIAFYTVLVGASASVLRAAIMGCFALIARQMGRQTGINTLAITAALMAGDNPHIIWDVGFQLSFAATLGLVLYAEPLQTWFARLLAHRLPPATARRIAGPAGDYFLFTLAAQVMTLPIIAYHFQRISLVSIVANPVILPAQPPVMILGGLAVLLGLIW